MENTITDETLAGTEQNVPAADGSAAGSQPDGTTEATADAVEIKDLLKDVLNKEFPTNEAAIKSLKDTYSYVGQMGQKVTTLEKDLEAAKQNEVPADLAKTVEQLQNEVREAKFYAANPDYNTPEAQALINKFGGNPEEVVKDEVFQKAFTAIKTTADMEQSKSVLHSNPRLGQVQDNMTKAVEASKAGDDAGANANAVAAVLDAYDLK